MYYFRKLLKNLKSEFPGRHWAGLFFQPDGSYHFIEITKKKNSYVPVLWKKGFLESFGNTESFQKKYFVKKIKYIRKTSKTKTLFLGPIANKNFEREIISSIKISGFEKVIVIKKNKEGVILNRHSPIIEVTVVFNPESIVFYVSNGKKILKKQEILIADFSVSKVSDILKDFIEDGFPPKVFLLGVPTAISDSVKNVFYTVGLKTKNKNIWENFLDFSDEIPKIFMSDSHLFIDVLSITVPELKIWDGNDMMEYNKKEEMKKEKENEKIEEKKEEEIKKEEENEKPIFLPKKREKTFLRKNVKKIFLKKEKKEKILIPEKKSTEKEKKWFKSIFKEKKIEKIKVENIINRK